MPITIIMPKFGLSMEEGTIGEWYVKEGDAVKKGDSVANVISEKLNNEAVAPEDGTVAKLMLGEGDTLPCGEPIAILTAPGEQLDAGTVTKVAAPASAPPVVSAAQPAAAIAPTPCACAGGSCDSKITPRAKKIAEERGIAYDHITGTGRHGFITIDDLKREGTPVSAVPAAEGLAPAPHPLPAAPVVPVASYIPAAAHETVVAMSPMQKAVSRGMAQSLANAAQVTIMTEADVQPLVDVYAGLKDKYGAASVKLSYTAMLVKAVAMALEAHPDVRRRQVDENHYAQMEAIDIGVAVDVPDGLIVPVIRAANLKDLRAICLELADLSARAQTGRLLETEMGGGVITISNLGMFGITYFTPVLNEPEPCLLGVGAITEKLVIRDGGIFKASAMNLSLTHDHRVINGAPAARFLREVTANLGAFRWI